MVHSRLGHVRDSKLITSFPSTKQRVSCSERSASYVYAGRIRWGVTCENGSTQACALIHPRIFQTFPPVRYQRGGGVQRRTWVLGSSVPCSVATL